MYLLSFAKKKQRKNKPETNEIGYLQWQRDGVEKNKNTGYCSVILAYQQDFSFTRNKGGLKYNEGSHISTLVTFSSLVQFTFFFFCLQILFLYSFLFSSSLFSSLSSIYYYSNKLGADMKKVFSVRMRQKQKNSPCSQYPV